MAPQSILIVGCGIAGPVLASFLLLADGPAANQPRITIVERANSLRAQGQNVDIRGAGVTIMRKLGLETAIRSSTTGEEGVLWVDDRDRVWARSAADRTGRVQTGTSDIEILRGLLGQIFYDRSKTLSEESKRQHGPGIGYIFGDYLESIDQQGQDVLVKFAKSGKERRFDLIVGADGLLSRTRRLVFGEAAEKEHVHKLGMYGGFYSMPKGGNDSEWRRWFHAPGRRGIMVRPSHEKHRSTVFMMVMSDDPRFDEAAARELAGVEPQKALLKETFQGTGWETERLIKEMYAADDFYYHPVAQVKMPTWSKGRVVLLADAGYCASPISGMGTTLALTGAYNLAGALKQHPNDHTAAFAAYERTMRPIVAKAQKLAPGAPHSLLPDTAWGLWLMSAILWLATILGLPYFIAKLAGPPAEVPVEEYGFKVLEDGWRLKDEEAEVGQ